MSRAVKVHQCFSQWDDCEFYLGFNTWFHPIFMLDAIVEMEQSWILRKAPIK